MESGAFRSTYAPYLLSGVSIHPIRSGGFFYFNSDSRSWVTIKHQKT